jgi:dolichyldiphosphatase
MSDLLLPLEWFVIEYTRGDLLGWICAWFSLMPFVILIVLGTLCLFRRDIHIIHILMGQVMNEGLNLIFKFYWRELRPNNKRKDYGMPSSHAQFMGYILAYLIALLRYHVRFTEGSSRSLPISEKVLKGICFTMLISVSFLVIFGRVYLNYHTPSQVLVGFICGTMMGNLWFYIYQQCLQWGWIDRLCRLTLAERLMIKNLANVPNPLRYEYDMYRKMQKKRE